MGKKTQAPSPAVAKPSKKKAPIALTAAAVEPPVAEVADLQAATQLLDKMPADVLLAFTKSKVAALTEADSDDEDWNAKPRSRERLATLRTDIQARDAHEMRSYAEQTEQLIDGTIMIAEAVIRAIEPKT